MGCVGAARERQRREGGRGEIIIIIISNDTNSEAMFLFCCFYSVSLDFFFGFFYICFSRGLQMTK